MSLRILIALCAAAFVFGAGLKLGYDHSEGRHAKAELEQQRLSDAITHKLKTDFRVLDTQRAEREAIHTQKDIVITKEVIRYVQVTPAANRVVLPGTWRLSHDASATGEPAGAGPYVDGASDPVEDAAALETVSDNYKACRYDKRRLKDLQDRYRLIEAACNPKD